MFTRTTIATALVATLSILGATNAQAFDTKHIHLTAGGGFGGDAINRNAQTRRSAPAATIHRCIATARRNGGNGQLIPTTRSAKKAKLMRNACARAMNMCKIILANRKADGLNQFARCVVVRRNNKTVAHKNKKRKKQVCIATAKQNRGKGKNISSTRSVAKARVLANACRNAMTDCRVILARRKAKGKNPLGKCVVVRRNNRSVVRNNNSNNSKSYRCVATAKRARGNGKAIPSTRSSKVAGKQGVACTRALNGCSLALLNRKANGKNKFAKCIIVQRALIN